jgi:hypothetical protein
MENMMEVALGVRDIEATAYVLIYERIQQGIIHFS